MANDQKRMLTAANSKLGNANLVTALRKEDAWMKLSAETRTELYALLPEPAEGEPPHDIDVNPLKTPFRSHIEMEARVFQEDLKAGRETKKWRNEAIEAGVQVRAGKFDEWIGEDVREKFGPRGQENDGEQGEENDSEEGGKSALESRMDHPEGLPEQKEDDSDKNNDLPLKRDDNSDQIDENEEPTRSERTECVVPDSEQSQKIESA